VSKEERKGASQGISTPLPKEALMADKKSAHGRGREGKSKFTKKRGKSPEEGEKETSHS